MIELTIGELRESMNAFPKILELKTSITHAFDICLIIKECEKHLSAFNETIKSVLLEPGLINQEGNPVDQSPEGIKKFKDIIEPLLLKKIKINCKKISVSKAIPETAEIEPLVLIKLHWMLEK